MPNHVSNKITFSSDHAEIVFAVCCPNGKFDFDRLIPAPTHMYRGDLSSEEEKDFACNWLTWSRENWGTKWNAYSCQCLTKDGKAIILFDTAWSIPYPVISAFANKFVIPFEHRYFDEGHNFWGIETWGPLRDMVGTRLTKRKNCGNDKRDLCIELKGYDPENVEEEES